MCHNTRTLQHSWDLYAIIHVHCSIDGTYICATIHVHCSIGGTYVPQYTYKPQIQKYTIFITHIVHQHDEIQIRLLSIYIMQCNNIFKITHHVETVALKPLQISFRKYITETVSLYTGLHHIVPMTSPETSIYFVLVCWLGTSQKHMEVKMFEIKDKM